MTTTEKVNLLYYLYIQLPLYGLYTVIGVTVILGIVKALKPSWMDKVYAVLTKEWT